MKPCCSYLFVLRGRPAGDAAGGAAGNHVEAGHAHRHHGVHRGPRRGAAAGGSGPRRLLRNSGAGRRAAAAACRCGCWLADLPNLRWTRKLQAVSTEATERSDLANSGADVQERTLTVRSTEVPRSHRSAGMRDLINSEQRSFASLKRRRCNPVSGCCRPVSQVAGRGPVNPAAAGGERAEQPTRWPDLEAGSRAGHFCNRRAACAPAALLGLRFRGGSGAGAPGLRRLAGCTGHAAGGRGAGQRRAAWPRV